MHQPRARAASGIRQASRVLGSQLAMRSPGCARSARWAASDTDSAIEPREIEASRPIDERDIARRTAQHQPIQPLGHRFQPVPFRHRLQNMPLTRHSLAIGG